MKSKNQINRRISQAIIESLEIRKLLSGVTFANGVLTIAGSSAGDTIAVNYDVSDPAVTGNTVSVTLNGQVTRLDGQVMRAMTINAGDGSNSITITGSENGTYGISDFPITVNTGAGDDSIWTYTNGYWSGSKGPQITVNTGNGRNYVEIEGPSTSTLNGGSGPDDFSAGNWAYSTMYGGEGDDRLGVYSAFYAGVTAYGQGGNDSFTCSDVDSYLVAFGGPGIDTFLLSNDDGSEFRGSVLTLDGNYSGSVCLNSDVENVIGSNYGPFTVIGNAANNFINVSTFDGTSVSLVGGDGNDTLSGGSGLTYLDGGNGNDTLIDNAGDTHFSGGAGNDTVDYSARTVDLRVYLNGSQYSGDPAGTYYDSSSNPHIGEHDTFDGTVETVLGGSGNDLIVGTTANNVLFGNAGNDTLVSGGGTDALFGGLGNDQLTSQDNANTFVDGGPGADTGTVDPADQVANVEIYHFGSASYVQLTGTPFGTAGSYKNSGTTIAKALDGDLNTYFDGPSANGAIVGMDLGAANRLGQLKFAPRAAYPTRMVGGKFEASNSSNFSSFTTLYTVATAPAAGALTTVNLPTTPAYRYVRYVAPNGSYGDISEFQLFAYVPDAISKQTGTVIGTPGSYKNHGTVGTNAFDGNFTTFFDGPDASGDWVGLDLGSSKIVTQVKYAARIGWETRMGGGMIQASNSATFSSGVVTLLTINSKAASGSLTTQSLTNKTAYRYYRYIGPTNSYCDIAELEFDS